MQYKQIIKQVAILKLSQFVRGLFSKTNLLVRLGLLSVFYSLHILLSLINKGIVNIVCL